MYSEKYERTELLITEFAEEDVITTSLVEDLYELLNPTGNNKSMRQTR